MINTQYFIYSIGTLAFAGFFASLFTSLSVTGDAGLPRLIERETKHRKRLALWQSRWPLLCKTARLLLTLCAIANFILYYLALKDCSPIVMSATLFLLALLYMLVARIIPHVLSESYADRVSLLALPLIAPLTLLMIPFVWPLQYVENKLLQHAMRASDEKDRPSPEDEIKSLIEDTDDEELEEEEREIIRCVFEFGETVTREIMTPRIHISGVRDSMTVNECIQHIKESRHSRFPVYHENIDDVVGLIHVKDLLKHAAADCGDTELSKIAKKIQFVPESMPINDLMKLMKDTHSQAVLVVDEYGGTEGLVTMEDIIEELVGDIEDEYDLKETGIHRRPDGSFVVNARMSIDELNEEIDAGFPESDEFDSLGGYIIDALGRIPVAGETLSTNKYTIKIQSATNRQVQIVHLIPHSKTD
jgi:putative hemolysin